jgi:hypothetical protein
MKALATALLALALLPATALAKTGLMVDSTPDGLTAGQSWDARFQFVRNDGAVDPVGGKVPYVRITRSATGATTNFPARRQHNGMWAARVVFAQPGEYSYSIEGFPPTRYRQAFEPVEIAAKPRQDAPAVVAASTGGGGSFPWGWTIAGAALALAGGVIVLRRLRT